MPKNASKDLEKMILQMLSDRPRSVSQLADELSLRRDFLSGFLEALKIQGKIELIVVGRSHVYRPV